ncbi:MAG: TIR domain-containing protein [Gammaproteobacteria bacterium]|nr:TIR domain-containing protein [Gammaproteobacteria bacterium]
MTAKIYLSFDDANDSARANRVRRYLLGQGYEVSRFHQCSNWERSRGQRPDYVFGGELESELKTCQAVLVLIGGDTAANRWVRHAIGVAHDMRLPMMGLYVDQLPDERGNSCERDINPFDRFAFLDGGRKVRLSERCRTLDWQAACDSDGLDTWLQETVEQQLGHSRRSLIALSTTQSFAVTLQ